MEKELINLLWYAVKHLERMRFEMKNRGDARKVNYLYKQLETGLLKLTSSEVKSNE